MIMTNEITDAQKRAILAQPETEGRYASEIRSIPGLSAASAYDRQRMIEILGELEREGLLQRGDNGGRRTPGPYEIMPKGQVQLARLKNAQPHSLLKP
jgi:hypothetical protein